MDWRFKASIQKILALYKLGDQFNHYAVTVNKNYHKNVVLYQTYETIRKINHASIDLTQKNTALEIGTGYSLISCVVLSLLGFEKIITVDITKDASLAAFKKQIAHMEMPEILSQINAKSCLKENEIRGKIRFLKEQTSLNSILEYLNVIYIAPYKFEDIEKYTHSFDYITSQVVLEHIQPEVLDSLFKRTKVWLKGNGYCVHTINFIDHFANPGFFQDKSISEFNFLRFSDKYWRYWAGNSIAYTNRLTYVYYLELCEKYDIEIVGFFGENYRKPIPLNPNLIHKDVVKKYAKLTDVSDLTKYQRGTLILKG